MTQARIEAKVSKDEVKNDVVSEFLSHRHQDRLSPVKRDEFQNLCDFFDGTASNPPLHLKIAKALGDFKGAAEFKNLHLDGFPKDDQAIEDLSKFIASKIIEINKAVYLINNVRIKEQEKIVLFEGCSKYFKILHEYLASEKILPPVKLSHDTQLLFWSSDIGQVAANAYAKNAPAMTDTTAGTKYINQLYGYDLLKTFYEDVHNEPLKTFYWRAISYIYASQLDHTSKSPIVFLMDTITEKNYFTEVELPILRNANVPIILRRIDKVIQDAHLDIPGEQALCAEINAFDRSPWSVEMKKDTKTTTLHVDLLDKTTKNLAGTIDIVEENKVNAVTKTQTRNYKFISTIGTGNNKKIKIVEFDDPKKLAGLWNVTWQGEIKQEIPLDLFFATRTLVKSTESYKRRKSIEVSPFSKGVSRELSSPAASSPAPSRHARTNSIKSPRLGLAYELPLNHAWLYAYLEHNACTGYQHPPVFGPLYYFEDALKKIPDQAEKEKTAIEFMKLITKQVKTIREIIDSNYSEKNLAMKDKRLACYQAYSQIIVDSMVALKHIRKIAKSTIKDEKSPHASEKATVKKPSVSWKFMFLHHKLNEYLEEATAEIYKLNPPPPPQQPAGPSSTTATSTVTSTTTAVPPILDALQRSNNSKPK